MYGSTRYSNNYCGTYKINSLGPKRFLKTQIFGAKGKLSSDEKTWPIFSRTFECEKPRWSKRKGPRGFPAFNVEVIRSFFGPKGSIETKFLKNSCFHRDNRFRPIFRRIIGDEKTSETIYTGPQATLTFTVEVIRSFV